MSYKSFTPATFLLPGMIQPFAVSIDPVDYYNQSGPEPQQWFFGPNTRNNTGWILCDGSEIWQSIFPQLFAFIGDTYGGSISSGKVKLPDYRGMFFRMVAQTASQDPGLSPSADLTDKRVSAPNGRPNDVGSTQQDMVQNHAHAYNEATIIKPDSPFPTYEDGANPLGNNTKALSGSQVFAPSVKVSTAPPQLSGSESRPKNIYINYLIYAGDVPAMNRTIIT